MQALKLGLNEPSDTTIGGYTLESQLGEGATSRVFAVTRGGRRFALKLMREDVGPDLLAVSLRFRKEAETLSRMNHPALVRVFELGEHEDRPYVVMELVTGQVLAEVLRVRSLSELEIVAIAKGLAGALAEIHRNGVIHRDIKPDNILIDAQGSPKLIDFGFAEAQAELRAVNDEAVGTFLYASPEQSGMLEAPVDSPSDLYSLGAVLFECAAGRPPFEAKEVSELLRKHVMEPPPSVRQFNTSVGYALAAIIAKLLSKSPQDRYQTGEGLLFDLDGITVLEAEYKSGGKVTLAQRDFRLGRQNDMPLLGRAAEMEMLRSEVERQAKDAGTSFLIEGEPGSGKSYLVKKFIDSLSSEADVLVLSGKCQLAEQTPFGPLREAIDNFLRNLARRDESSRETALRMVDAASVGIEIFVRRLSRGLAERLSARHIEGSVESSQTQEQFFSSIAEFFCQLARLHKRLVLHIDDVQWLDQASLATLMQIQERIKSSPIVLLMTARNDGASLEALNKFIGMWPIGNGARRLTLKPLGVEAMDEIIKVQLGGSGLRPQLVERLAAKASGNPFAISQYIYAMVDARVLQRSGAQWVVDESRLDQLIVSTNIIDIVLARAKGLSPTTLEVLQAAAIIGTKFDEALVGQVIQTPAVVSTALNDATRANLIESLGHGLYAFVHDRILEALLKDLSSSQISGLHQRVAEIMDARPEAHDLYALASHYAHGEHAKIPLRTYQTCFDAGLQALENFANDDAAEFLEVAYSVKQTHLQKLPPPNVLELHQALGMAYWRKGVGQRAIGHCTRVLELTSDPLLQAQVRAMMTNIYFNENQGSQGWVESERGLATMGTSFPKSRFLAHLMNLVHWLRYTIYRRLGLGYGQATGLELKRRCVMLSLYGPSTFASFVGLRYEITAQLVPRMLFQLHRVGDRIESVPGFAFYAFWLGFHGARAACVKMAEHAIEIAQNRADNQMLATARYYSGFGIHWSGQPQLAEQFQKQSLMAYGKWMAPRSYISTANDLAGNNLLIRGHARDALAIVELCQKKAQSTKNQSAIAVSQALALGVHAVLGNEAEIEKLLSGLKDIYGKIAEDSLDWCWYLAHLLLYHLECDRSIDDLDGWIARYNRLRVDPRRAPLFFKTMYLYAAYAALRAYVHADAANVRTARARFRECHRRFQQCCGQMPHWLCHDWIMRAECALHEGRLTTAVAYINRAEKLAEESDSPWGLFLAYRNQARIARAKNRLDDIVSYARRAEMLAAEHRWKQRQASLRKEFQADFARVKVTEHHQVNRASGADVSSIRRQLDALLAISRVSARHNGNLKEMVSETLNELVRVFSADRAFLLLLKADGSLDHYGRSSGGETLSQLSGYSSTVVDKVISERRSMIVASTGEGALIGSMSAVAHDLRSIIAAPLVCNQRLIGALYLDSRMSNNLFHKDDIRLLEGVCDHVAVFVDAAHISNKLQALLDISLASGVVLDPEAQARIALDEVISILGAQRAFLFQVDEVSHQLKPWFGRDSHKQDLTEIKGYSSTVVTRAHREQQPVLVTGSAEGELLGSRSAVIHDLRSIMAAPLVNKGHQLGVLYLDSQVVKGGFRPDDTKVLMSISNMISIAFITSKITKLEIERRRLESNLEVTGSVQSLLLPQQSVSVQDQLGVAGYCQSAEQSGGDWWWHERLPNGNHLVALGDITGHGAGPAMVAAMVAGIFRTVVPQLTQLENNLSELGPLLNEKLLDICQGNYWMTMAVAEINSVTGKTSLWTAASPDPLILRAGREVEVVPGYGSFLGSSKDFDVGYTELTLSRGDILLIPSDGVYEMRTRKDRQLGQRVSMKILQEVGTHGNIEDVRDAFINRINKERGSTPLADDLTFVVVKRL